MLGGVRRILKVLKVSVVNTLQSVWEILNLALWPRRTSNFKSSNCNSSSFDLNETYHHKNHNHFLFQKTKQIITDCNNYTINYEINDCDLKNNFSNTTILMQIERVFNTNNVSLTINYLYTFQASRHKKHEIIT